MEIVPLGPGFAAEIRGVTLADVAADDAVYAGARAAFEEHSVLVFRGQEVDGESQLAFSKRFGPPEITRRHVASWCGMRADAVQVTRYEPFEYSFRAPYHLLIASERAERLDGETRVEGLATSALRNFSHDNAAI